MNKRIGEINLGRYSLILFVISTITLVVWLALTTIQSDSIREADARSNAMLERLEATVERTANLVRSVRGLILVGSNIVDVTEDVLARYLEGVDVEQNYKEILSISVLKFNPEKQDFFYTGVTWRNNPSLELPALSDPTFAQLLRQLGLETVASQRTRIKPINKDLLAMTVPMMGGDSTQMIYCLVDLRMIFSKWLYDVSTADVALLFDGESILAGKGASLFAVKSFQEKMIFGRKVSLGVSSTYQYTSLDSKGLVLLLLFQLLSTALLVASYKTQNRLRAIAEDASKGKEDALTAERAARNGMERALRVKDEFLGAVSHELRSPLNAILGWAQLLLRSKVNAEQIERGLTVIERNVHQQTRLIEDLLDLSRSVSGKLLLERKKFMLHHLVEDQVEQATFIAHARNITLQVKKLEPVLMVGDEKRFEQILGNLLNNAIKFSNQGGTIFVSLEIVDNQIRLEVEDDGIGIGSGYLSNLFEKFHQYESTTTRQYGGLGIGLSIVKLFTELHGGKVWGESTGRGEGSRFVVTFPYDTENKANTLAPVADATVTDEDARTILQSAKILVVDDEDDAREVVAQILKETGASIVETHSAETAFEAFLVNEFDAVVSDISMPEEDGFSLAKRLRALPKGRKISLIALSALARLEDKADAIKAGFDDHVSKPLNAFELTKKIATYIVRYRDANQVYSNAE